ncbi:endo alpha-1,4 polygalactosaminidase [Amycolatopsis panacis]|nr:endo alpha-1,4 polygalactosaminidase [Amycolatopsis panacis]
MRFMGRFLGCALAAALLFGASACSTPGPDTSDTPAAAPSTGSAAPRPVNAPPTGAPVDYQLGGAYPPPEGVTVVSRDHGAAPAAGLYNICYVNAFQAQPGADAEWDADLLLRAGDGKLVVDNDWHETLLDLRTPEKRERIAAKVYGWIDQCADKGFQAVEPDNYDSFLRSEGLLTDAEAQEFVRLLSAHAHGKGLAVAQKNTSELAPRHAANGLDFAVVEECGEQGDCAEYVSAFGDHVIVIEYTDDGLAKACAEGGGRLSIVRRDHGVAPLGNAEYVRKTC